jgi:Bifunctional DNA primase/polymerase, N-terminal
VARSSEANEAAGILSAALSLAGSRLLSFPLFSACDGCCRCGDPDCGSPAKHPLTVNGAHDASSDPVVLRHWFEERWPWANLGLATTGLRAYDRDGESGQESFQRLEHLYGRRFPRTRTQRSGRRVGDHLIYALPDGFKPSASPRLTARQPDLHIRSGPGMYLVAAPSVHVSGAIYETDGHPIVQLPAWALEPPPGFKRPGPSGVLPEARVAARDRRYGLAALRSEQERLLGIVPGEGRHDGLNVAAYRMGQLVFEGKLTLATAYGTLVPTGIAIGILERDSRRIVRLGLEAGLEQPRCS